MAWARLGPRAVKVLFDNWSNKMTQSQNDTPLGYHWVSEPVSLVYGDNQSDKRIVNDAAQILVIDDIEAWRANFGDAFLLATANGTSPRVICQRVGRKAQFHGGRNIEANRTAVLAAVAGIRASGTSTVRHALPDGTFYHGLDETEFRQLYAAGLVDAGVDGGIATALAARIAF